MSDLIIPLEPREPSDDAPIAFTDIITALVIENVETREHGDETFYDVDGVALGSALAFAIGCAVGVEFPERIEPALAQTHGDDASSVIEACRAPLAQAATDARRSTEPPAPADFISELLDSLAEIERADIETAQSAISVSFEYGLLLAHTQRAAALVLRNAFDRSRKEEFESAPNNDDPEAPPGSPGASDDPDDFETLQEIAREVMASYEEDIGFAP